MKLLTSKLLEPDVVELTLDNPVQTRLNWLVGETVEIFEDNDSFYLKQGVLFEEVTFQHLSLARALNRNDPQVVIAVIYYKTSTAVAVKFMYLRDLCPENITINLDAASINNIGKVSGGESKLEVVQKWFELEFYFYYDQKKAVLCEFSATALGDSFKIIGSKYAASVIKNDKSWFINTVIPLTRVPEKLTVFVGEHELVKYDSSEQMNKPAQQLILEQHTKLHGSYFQLWLKYSETHWLQASRIAKTAGFLSYSQCKSISDEKIQYQFILGENPIKSFLSHYKTEQENIGERFNIDNLELQVSVDVPDYLIDKEGEVNSTFKSSKKPILLTDLKFDSGKLEATINKKPPKEGVIYISLNGIKKAHDRKMSAFNLLREGNNPLPQIKHIFEGLQPPKLRAKRIKALSAKAKEQFKGGKPTRLQEKAIKVALNTPDIALIIGPPGTGKTQVISALQQRIAEEGDKFGSSLQHQVLLSSYQHDAVSNVVERSGVFGLPALKIGGRQNDRNPESGVSKWSKQRVEKLSPIINCELEKFVEYKSFETINKLILSIRLSNSPAQLKTFLLTLRKKLGEWQVDYGFNIQASTLNAIETLTDRFSYLSCFNLSIEDKTALYPKARSLRTTQLSFDDDGVLRANTLLTALERLDDVDEIQEYAQELKNLINEKVKPSQYESIKHSLLDGLKSPYVIQNSRQITGKEIDDLEQLQEILEVSLTSKPTLGKLYLRQQYVNTLLNQPGLVEKSVEEYVTVLGATCQQAAGDKMTNLKDVEHSANINFDSVIIDEAARANPLDLMIPMAMARTRIVLVGDHKQLPHMLEPQVEKELQDKNELEITDHELLKQSLFERLHDDLKKFEDEGGPKRVVMLDTQFRMHPVLGEFHSKEFYESAGLPAVKSGLPESHFPLDVPNYEGTLATWIDVGQKSGKMQTKNGSKYRQCEAEIIAQEAATILKERPDLSVGIITFYAAQRDEIQKLMVNKGVMQFNFGEYEPNVGYDYLSNGDERFRVGSVDAFQGKEFDVVLLSTVRSWKSPSKITTEVVNKQLGFLRIINRINVAMSRQKRLLIVVGDKSLAGEDLAKSIECEDGTKQQVLPGFNAFYKLCEGEYGDVR